MDPSSEGKSRWTRVPTWLGTLIILLTIAVTAIPGPITCGRRQGANESAAYSTLRNIAFAQEQAVHTGLIDRDQDGRGEFGWLAELAGGPMVFEGSDGLPIESQLDPPLLSSRFLDSVDGSVVRSGYRFSMYLPSTDGGFVRADQLSGEGSPKAIDPERATREWRCYAFPSAPGQSGSRVFVVDQDGVVLARDQPASTEESEAWDPGTAALATDRSRLAVDTIAVGGRRWSTVR